MYVQMTLDDLINNNDCKKCYYGWHWNKCLLSRRNCKGIAKPAPDAEKIISLFRDGVKLSDIAKKTGTDAGMVAAIVKELG